VKGWVQLKDAFWAAAEADPSEHPRHVAALASIDPDLARRLEALLAADARGESLQQIFGARSDVKPPERLSHIGTYAVTGVLGVGGMGEVYRARDTRLNRDVAVKVLPPAVNGDPGRRARFEREAQVLASLNHPHIAQLYGLDESGHAPALVMELVEGPTLAQIVANCREAPLALVRVFEIGRQIADGLQAAHEKGVIHRDLKPGNVALTKRGDVKILDFGVATTLEAATRTAPHESDYRDAGAVLGTPAYMSPEQARGLRVDERTDVWAFGCLLYELLTGRQPFGGLSPSDTLAAIVERHPDMALLPPGTPAGVRSLLAQCLEKDPSRRLRDIGRARRALDDALSEAPGARARHGGSGNRWSRPRASALVAGGLLALGSSAAILQWQGSGGSGHPAAVPLTSLSGSVSAPALSPDGSLVAFSWTGPQQDNHDLYIQQIGDNAPRRLTTDPGGDHYPRWSPDGRSIAFLRRPAAGPPSELRVIQVLGGVERKLADIQPTVPFGGLASLAWCPDGTCVLVSDSTGPGKSDALFAIPLAGGDRRQVTYPQGLVADVDPSVSPDGRSLVFRRQSAPFNGAFYRLALDERMVEHAEPVRLTETIAAGSSTWTLDGRDIIFSARRSLWRLDAMRGGTPTRLPFVGQDGHSPVIARTADGAQRLMYLRSVSDSNVWRLSPSAPGVPVSEAPVKAIASTRDEFTPGLSPDGRRLAFWSNRSGEPQIWTADIDGSHARQLTSRAFRSFPAWPRWSPDGRLIAFHGDPADRPDVLVVPAEGGADRIVTADLFSGAFPNFSRDNRTLYLCRWDGPETRIWKVPLAGGPPVRVTQDPGFAPIESPDGRDLYYVTAADRSSKLWRVPVAGGAPVEVLNGVLWGNFDVVDGGIYYLEHLPGKPRPDHRPVLPAVTGETRLRYFDLATRRATTIAQNLGMVGHGLTVSRDGRNIFFARIDSAIDELMMVDGFM
jgi:serine/threonine protein kinase/dipeptidyl aminopeptidase/acylaminoacyl peptidase